jgi:hypothetical protein
MTNPNEARQTSEARIDANRENAKKSTGPRSAAGKAASSRNRLLHGLRANKHILLDGENPEEFLLLLKDLDNTFRPAGEAEEMLVTRIAADQWRLDRALPLEAGIYRARLEGVAASDDSRAKALVNHKRNRELHPDRFPPVPAPPDPDDRLARAFAIDCAGAKHLANFNRNKSSVELSIDRAIRQLKIYQAARIAAPGPGHQPSPPPDQPHGTSEDPVVHHTAPPAKSEATPAATPPKSADYHSNPTNGGISSSSVAAMLLAALAFMHAVPELIAALSALLIGPRTGHKRRKVNLIPPFAMVVSRIRQAIPAVSTQNPAPAS